MALNNDLIFSMHSLKGSAGPSHEDVSQAPATPATEHNSLASQVLLLELLDAIHRAFELPEDGRLC